MLDGHSFGGLVRIRALVFQAQLLIALTLMKTVLLLKHWLLDIKLKVVESVFDCAAVNHPFLKDDTCTKPIPAPLTEGFSP